jgi:A/G-specific adenine glycosylase
MKNPVPAPPKARKLLAWYDRHARILPWRAKPGETQDAYKIWLSEIMLQQTVVKAVIPYFEKFTKRWPTLRALAKAKESEIMAAWAGLGYYSRARKLFECAKLLAKRGGFPGSAEELIELPGIGPYTSAAIAAIAFNERTAVVDGNIERVISRVFAIKTPLPQAKQKIRELVFALTPKDRPGDFAQAMMDLGSAICTPKNPKCPACPWQKNCLAFALGQQDRFPIKLAKKKRETRRAAAFWIMQGDKVLLRRRPPRGLLGGMVEVPSEGWEKDFAPSGMHAPIRLPYKELTAHVTHTFTHFEAEISVYAARATTKFKSPENSFWQPVAKIDEAGLPSVMMKVARAALFNSSSPRKRDLQ